MTKGQPLSAGLSHFRGNYVSLAENIQFLS